MKDVGCLKFFGLREPISETNLNTNKIRTFAYEQLIWNLSYNVLDLCIFVIMVTGWDLSLWELFKTSERSINLTKIFNLKHGFSAKDDDLPEKYFQPLKNGLFDGMAIDKEEFQNALRIFYQLRG